MPTGLLPFFVSGFAFYAAGYVLLPTLPLILHDRGSSPAQVGLVMGVYTAASLLCRAQVGMALTRRSPLRLVRWGFVTFGIGFVAYQSGIGLPAFVAGRIVQGIGLAFFNTAAYVYLAEIAGPSRRAEFVSLFGVSTNVAMGLAPAAGSLALAGFGESRLYLLGLVASTVGLFLVPRADVPPATGAIARWWEREAWKPTAAMAGLALTYGTVMVFVPLAMERARLSQGWLFFSTYSVAIILTRLSTRRSINKGKRLTWAFSGSALLFFALGVLALASTRFLFLVAAALYGAGVGIGHPTLLVYILESVPIERRSAAAAMGTSAFDAGGAGGAAIAGWIAGRLSYSSAFIASALLLILFSMPLAFGRVRHSRQINIASS
jgi:MFS family permease